MKKYLYKTSRITAVICLLFVISCETTNLDINDNPNALTLESADPNFVLNTLQFAFTNGAYEAHAMVSYRTP